MRPVSAVLEEHVHCTAAIAADRAAYWHALYRSAVSETEKLRVEMAEMQRAVRVEAIVGQRGRVFPDLWREVDPKRL